MPSTADTIHDIMEEVGARAVADQLGDEGGTLSEDGWCQIAGDVVAPIVVSAGGGRRGRQVSRAVAGLLQRAGD